jgi:uncharacterized protein YbjT (DUF2867 family)
MAKEADFMPYPILVTGAAGGNQGSTGRHIASLLIEKGIPVRALVHRLDSRSDELGKRGAEVVEGDLLNPASVRAAMRGVRRAYFTYPVTYGLLEAATIFAAAAREQALELVVNNSQFQGTPEEPIFRDLQTAPTFRNLQHRLADRIFDWAEVRAVHLQAPPYYENVRALVSRSVSEANKVMLPWGEETTVVPLVGAEDVARVAATLLAAPGFPLSSTYSLVSETATVAEMTQALSRAIGRPVEYVAITDEQWENAVKERINPHALDHLTHLWQYFRSQTERRSPTDAIRAITGQKPQSLEEFFAANASAFGPSAHPSQES